MGDDLWYYSDPDYFGADKVFSSWNCDRCGIFVPSGWAFHVHKERVCLNCEAWYRESTVRELVGDRTTRDRKPRLGYRLRRWLGRWLAGKR